MKDYSIKNTTKEQRKEIVNSALALGSIDSHEPSIIVLELLDRYVEGELEIKEIQDIVLNSYKKKYLDGDERGIEKIMDKIIDENIDALKKLSE
ncbi:TPA: antitoxin VbhA family protein [Clostridioides difficile]|nr:antitoxin VbhA family protein [Clostridioides difficile]HBF7129551.1 antitoxin VbhA family protein [Clostridioides difficile]HCQ6330838.1 antitoxin VbhA family protein [Clostridioides difficile]